MACTSTRPSPGWLLDTPGRQVESEPATTPRESELLAENDRLRRICNALIERVESSGAASGAPYTAFEHTVLLAEQVRERTETLHHTLDELGQVNTQLRDEISSRVNIEERLREAKQDAEAANLSKTKFLAAVSHDLLQPLNAARLFTSALADHEVPEASRTLVGQISRSLKDVETLLGTLVDISRLDAGVLKPDIAPFAAGELLDALAEEYHQVAASQGLTLHYVPCNVVIDSDLQLLARVVRNFLTNAIRYTRHGRVLLGCRRRPQGLEIIVGDTGPGIDAGQREAIFQEFRRADTRDEGRERGLGLGLAIVDRIATMLSHPLTLHSVPGHGSSFSVLVPYGQLAAEPVTRAPSGTLPVDERLAGIRVWVIDNDPTILDGMQALLGGWGCQVVTAVSLDALSRATEDQDAIGADLLIVDYHLDQPGPNGLSVAQKLCETWPSLSVLLVTANHDAAITARSRELGYGCLLKPVKPLRLKMQLLNLLER
ncbi:hybrid sensor histidine kinase/response regulator [Halomonas elongata]|uniref:hybrid sensor histidine kinase/response regulator n=1 Tax=Halomonas elongata TaxID=2746 RepID=UPI003361A349